jgi:hypothetical protein
MWLPCLQGQYGEHYSLGKLSCQALFFGGVYFLTVVTQEWNSQLSNAIYETKQEKLASHGLRLNQVYFGDKATKRWNGESIQRFSIRNRW